MTPEGLEPTGTIPLTDRGFRYGMAIFETLRIDCGRSFFVEEHLCSLKDACAAASFPIERNAVAQLSAFLRNLPGTGAARVHVTAGDGAPADPVAAPRIFTSFEPRDSLQTTAINLQSSEIAHQPFLGGRKTHNYWPQTAALQIARAASADEALLFDPDGRLISAATANVFVLREDGALVTPPTALGARAGIIRQWILRRRAVVEEEISQETLRRAVEVFLTNSWIGVRSARRVDGRSLPGSAVAAALQLELQAHYDRIPARE